MKPLRGSSRTVHFSVTLFVLIFLLCQAVLPAAAQADDPNPPDAPVKLIFIHHSTGENWLRDDNGGLGLALAQNNYFVSDTNYGWGPNGIGDRTDIINWPEWFVGLDSPRYMDAVFSESQQHSDYSRLFGDPGGENQVILFKSCFPNSALEGNPDDPSAQSENLSVGGAKYIYNQLLTYFATRPDKLFVVITAPPLSDQTYADNARALNTWLVQDWLTENNYPYQNVAVFDFYNVLTGRDNHHRFMNGQVQYINDQGKNTSAYASGGGDDHPNQKGNQKAAEEFIPLLNVFYHRWQNSLPAPAIGQTQEPTPTSDNLRIEAGEPSESVEPTGQPSIEPAVETEVVEDVQDPASAESAGSQGSGGVCPFALAPAGLVIMAAIIKRKKTSN